MELRYKAFGGETWKTVTMTKKGDSYRGEVPCKDTRNAGTLRLYVRAKDAQGEEVDSWGKKTAPIEIKLGRDRRRRPAVVRRRRRARALRGHGRVPARLPRLRRAKAGAKRGNKDWGEECENSTECKSGLLCARAPARRRRAARRTPTAMEGDLTGIEIINRLAEQVWARDIERLEEHRAIELIKTPSGDAIAGVLHIDMRTGEYVFVQARAVLLATGGGPTMYKYHTPSGDKSCDGLAMALRAGLTLRDMEMVQFHPTGLLAGSDTRMTGTVLEEGLRGAGGYLLNGARERFMQQHDARAERATRDIVSRAIFAEMRTATPLRTAVSI